MITHSLGHNRGGTADISEHEMQYNTFVYQWEESRVPAYLQDWDDPEELLRLLNLEHSRWILKERINWAMPVNPINKKVRKNNKKLFKKCITVSREIVLIMLAIFI